MLPGAGVAKLVDARDLKSLEGNLVRVRVPAPALRRSRVNFLACLLLAAGGVAACSLDVEDPSASVTPFALSGIAASDHTCGIASNQAVWCWGYAAYGQLGDGVVIAYEARPVKVRSNAGFVSLATGMLHTCGLDEERTT